MSLLRDSNKRYGALSAAEAEWMQRIVADWQLVADLVMADLVAWVPAEDGTFVAVGHARPSSAATLFYRDISGQAPNREWANLIRKAFESGAPASSTGAVASDSGAATQRILAVPVRRRINARSEEVSAQPIAVITRHANLAELRTPTRISIEYQDAGNALLEMLADGTYPDFSNPTGPRRGAPRVNDGMVRIDAEGIITFANPNAFSAYTALGVPGELEGQSLVEAVTTALKVKAIEETLPVVLTGKAAWRADVESKNVTLSVRAVPLKREGKRIGAIVLSRDVSDLRRQERELITKDATIREIHHRVKNNLQTVASLLRIQSRRSSSPEVRESLAQAQRRVAAIALVHDTLSEGLAQEVNFDEVFDRVRMSVSELAATTHTSVNVIVDGKFGQLKSEVATQLAVVLTELISNSVEHGLAGRSGGLVAVSAERRQKQLFITVADNGKGLEEGKPVEGLGTQIIRTLITGELRGTISWLSPSDGGTKVVIAIPL